MAGLGAAQDLVVVWVWPAASCPEEGAVGSLVVWVAAAPWVWHCQAEE